MADGRSDWACDPEPVYGGDGDWASDRKSYQPTPSRTETPKFVSPNNRNRANVEYYLTHGYWPHKKAPK